MLKADFKACCPAELIENSYLAQLGQADAVWETVKRRIPDTPLDRLRECVFMLLKPDALVSGRSEALLAGMAKAGWQIIHAEATLTGGQKNFEELYQYNLTIRNEQNMMCAWWINARLYAMGPSLALLVRVPPAPSGLTAHQQVALLKGSSNPYKCSPGELRWEGGGTNLALNLLHSADDPISTAREFLIFGTPDQLTCALRQADRLAKAGSEAAAAAVLADATVHEQLFLAGTSNRRLDLPSVLTLVKGRLRATQRDEKFRSATQSLYARYLELAKATLDIKTRWARFCALSAEERSVLDELNRAEGNGSTRELLRHLAIPESYGYETAEDIRVELLRRRISIDPWDELALDTSLYYSELLP